MDSPSCWTVVVPVKPVRVAKSRLRVPTDELRALLVVAMAVDTVAAALGCPAVEAVYVVSSDPQVSSAVSALGVIVMADEPDAGLNPALVHAAEVASRAWPECGVSALTADLPALTVLDLAAALEAAGRCSRAMVADADSLGTTLLTAAPGVPLNPAFGPDSRRRHLDDGVVELDLRGETGLRCDVDTLDDLAAAEALGVGTRTRAVLRQLSGLGARPE